jgi:flagellar L-ring protein precursor FlgH
MISIHRIAFAILALPLIAGAQSPAADSSAPAPRVRNLNWLTDTRSFPVGAIIKVAIDEYALAAANKGTVAEASRERRMGVGGSASLGHDGSTTTFGPVDGSLETGDRGASRSRGEATRGTRYVAEIPVRVVAITAEGLLQVKGTKIIDVDRAKQEMTVTGLISPRDVDARDVVASTSIADARIVYTSKGLDKPRSGILGRVIGIIWP